MRRADPKLDQNLFRIRIKTKMVKTLTRGEKVIKKFMNHFLKLQRGEQALPSQFILPLSSAVQ
jgi:hypothetical protein